VFLGSRSGYVEHVRVFWAGHGGGEDRPEQHAFKPFAGNARIVRFGFSLAVTCGASVIVPLPGPTYVNVTPTVLGTPSRLIVALKGAGAECSRA